MSDDSYEFDPCMLDGSHVKPWDELEDDGITIETWKPSEKNNKLIQSEWRKRQIGNDFNQQPGLRDVRKIETLIDKKAPDSEIMRVFGINAQTLIAIKEKRYCPIEGIALGDIDKIRKEIKKLNNYAYMIFCLIKPEKEFKKCYAKYQKIKAEETKEKNRKNHLKKKLKAKAKKQKKQKIIN